MGSLTGSLAEPAPLTGKVPEVRAVENRAAPCPPEQESATSPCMQIPTVQVCGVGPESLRF